MSSFILEGLYTNNFLLFTCFEMASQFLFFTEVTWVSELKINISLLKSILMKNKKKKVFKRWCFFLRHSSCFHLF